MRRGKSDEKSTPNATTGANGETHQTLGVVRTDAPRVRARHVTKRGTSRSVLRLIRVSRVGVALPGAQTKISEGQSLGFCGVSFPQNISVWGKMIAKLGVKRQWFQTAAAKRMFPGLVCQTGVVLADADTGLTVRVRVSGRSVSIEPTRAAASGMIRGADVDSKFRTKARRAIVGDELPPDVFDPSCAHVPADCVLGGGHSDDSSCVVHLEPEHEPDAATDHRQEDEEEEKQKERCEHQEKLEQACEKERAQECDALLLETVKQLFDKTLCISRHVPVIRLPLASVTFQYLCESAPPRAVLERLGERYLSTLQSALRQSEVARGLYATRCVGAGADLRHEILNGTWE
jgi:hypothetical protein